ncbi:hypothetical protein [Streptomyces sp. B15]|uniref:hypothetical protein n=1 Tax=Streptomyces sp. B15 TaxID=1537797 RepID=UPI001B38BB12|nr:hypothetical protein [Streptomyces sp. B15]MBQ1122625.1 hypothetical protein [Streptomyces sp. B15]
MTEQTATLVVGEWDTECSNCGISTSPQDTHHTRVPGPSRYPRTPRPCGARFTAIAKAPTANAIRTLQEIRPDLPIVEAPRRRRH